MAISTVATDEKQVFTVSQLNRRARQLLETHLSLLWVEGELSNLARPSSGHWYFSLKDANAQIRCAMFNNRNRTVNFRPEDGQQVLVRGRVSLYENRGDYQLIVEHVEPAGLGALQRRFELLKAKLAAEGLFSDTLKRPLPQFARHIGVITSPSGAAVRDVLHVLQRRFPALPVTIYPTPVQGNAAAAAIVKAIELANTRNECDLLILTRGGGSLEDLWPFNEETVARAIAASSIPIISAVGHETDTTIADFVADARAPTPSAAAELASPDAQDLMQTLQGYQNWFNQQANTRLADAARALLGLRKRLRHPSDILNKQGQHLDHLEIRLMKSLQHRFQDYRLRLEQLITRYQARAPQAQVARFAQRASYLEARLYAAMSHLIKRKNDEFATSAALLQAVSPLNTLQRGYAIVQDQGQQVITHTTDTQAGDRIKVTLVDGALDCQVEEVYPDATDNP